MVAAVMVVEVKARSRANIREFQQYSKFAIAQEVPRSDNYQLKVDRLNQQLKCNRLQRDRASVRR